MSNHQLMLAFQKNLLGIADELDQIRLSSPKDINILSTNIGRIQGMANGLDWYLAHTAKKELPSAMGFDLSKTHNNFMSPEEEEIPVEEEEEPEDKGPFQKRR